MKSLTNMTMLATGAIGFGSLAAAGVGIAAAATHGGVIHSCVAKSNGELRIVRSAHDCTSHEKLLSFNAKGARGLQGPRGLPGATAQAATFQMYANVDAEGHLGSHVDAKSAFLSQVTGQYEVTFTKPISHCAVITQSGKVGGDDFAGPYPSLVNFDGADSIIVAFVNPTNQVGTNTPFMVTATCPT